MIFKIVKVFAAAAIIIIFIGGTAMLKGESQALRLFSLKTDKELPITDALSDLSTKRIVLVGERHSEKSHHIGQLRIIQALCDAGIPLAIGFEMFEKSSQPDLDKWVSGQMAEKDFKRVYYKNWNYPWSLYSDIFA